MLPGNWRLLGKEVWEFDQVSRCNSSRNRTNVDAISTLAINDEINSIAIRIRLESSQTIGQMILYLVSGKTKTKFVKDDMSIMLKNNDSIQEIDILTRVNFWSCEIS